MKPFSHQLWLSCIAIATASGAIAVSPTFASQFPEGEIASLQLAQVPEQSTSVPAIQPFTVTGRLDENSNILRSDRSYYNTHTFEGVTGQAITIEMSSDTFDTYLILLDPNGQKIAENDDSSSGGTNSWIVVTLPATGNYTILANSYAAGAVGSYTLSLREASPSALASNEINRILNQGLQQLNTGQFQAAAESFQQALAWARQTNNPLVEAFSLNGLGRVFDATGQYAQSLEQYQQALTITRQLGDRAGEGTTLNNIGLVYYNLDQYPQSLEQYQQALTIARQLGDRTGEGSILTGIGAVYRSLGQYPQALEYYQQALTIVREVGDRAREGRILNNIGSVYGNLSQYPQELEQYQQALTIIQEVGDRAGEGVTLSNIGSVYSNLGQYPQALEQYQRALTIARQVGDRAGQGVTLNNIGLVYDKLGQYPQALEHYQQALTIRREVGDRAGEGVTLNNIGAAYGKLGQYSQALEHYQQALTIRREVGDRAGEGVTLNNIGLVYDNLGQYPQSLEQYQRALTISRQVGDRDGEGITLNNMGYLLAAQDQPELAIVFLKQSVNVREAIRGELRTLSTEQQQSFTDTVAYSYRKLTDLLLQQGRVMEAQEILDLLKLQELDDYLQNVQGNEQTEQGVYTWEFEDQILAEFETAVQQGQDFEAFVNSAGVATRVAALQRIAREQRIPEALLTELQDNLRQLDRPAALLYPLILEDRLEVVVILPNAPPLRHTVAVTQAELEATIQSFRQYLTQRTSRRIAPAQQLYDWLIRPIASDLQQAGVETLLYAADGQLRYIPLAALHDGEQWLVQQFTINQITAASLTNFAASREANLRVLAGAYSDRQLTYEFAIGERQFSFNGLEYAGVEVEAIASSIPQTTTFFDRNFSRSAVEPQLGNYTVVHFATHAEFVSGVPEESFILFGNGDRLSLRELSGLSLPDVDLVVLSACRTAVSGALGNGEEILGFGYQIQQTGADAAIASLWYVNDGGTQVLMDAFYTALNNGYSKAEALQRAQIALITSDQSVVEGERGATVDIIDTRTGQPLSRSNDLAHPYYWAPFILIGNGL